MRVIVFVTLLLLLLLSMTAASLETVSVQFLTRHGARAPYLSIPGITLATWYCDFSVFQYPQTAPVSPAVDFDGQLYRKTYIPGREALPGNCSQGQLTNVGAEMLRDSGRWLRSKAGSVLPAQWDSNIMYARSTDVDRTYASAENLLQALFPPASNRTVASGSKSGSAKRSRGVTTDVVNIYTIEKGYDDLDVAQNAPCPRLREECSQIATGPAWEQHVQGTEKLRAQLADAFNVPVANIPDIFLVLEVLRARRAQGLPLPGITDAMYNAVEAAATWELVALYNNTLVHTLTSGQILQEMVQTFQDVVSGNSKRVFTLYAAHDTTVAPMALALQLPLNVWPQYASSIYYGLLQDTTSGAFFVELLYDRKPVMMSGCTSPCPWAQFVAIAQKNFVSNRPAACQSRKRVVLADPVAEYLC